MDNINLDEKLTDEQIDQIKDDFGKVINFLKDVDLESTKGKPFNDYESKPNYDPNTVGDNEKVIMSVGVNPATGERIMLSPNDSKDISMDSIADSIDSFYDDESITEEDIKDNLKKGDMFKEGDIPEEDIAILVSIANRMIKKENFNIYKACPDSIQIMVDNYIVSGGSDLRTLERRLGISNRSVNEMRNSITKSLMDRFIDNIRREKHRDFARDLELFYQQYTDDITDIGEISIMDRNKHYRDYISKIEDPNRKRKMEVIIDRIDDAFSLNELKEYSKKCKIKDIELRKYNKIFNEFLNKYKNSYNNIYDINLAKTILTRILKSEIDAVAFLICFCSYCKNFKDSNIKDHTFMYYVLYYCVMIDVSDASVEFINNIEEVVSNLKAKNNILK